MTYPRPRRRARARLLLALLLTLGGLLAVFPAPAGAQFLTWNVHKTLPIVIPASGSANNYPSTITMSDVCGLTTKVTLTLHDLTHTHPRDLDVLLVAPGGQKLLAMSDAGGVTDVANLDITLADDAASGLPDPAALTSGTFKPTNFAPTDMFAAPAPAGPYGATTFAGAFNGADPNGEWRLFIVDDASGDSGFLGGGWQLKVTTDCAILSVPTVGGGSVARNPAGGNSDDAGGYDYGEVVTLTPSAPAGSVFVGWKVDGVNKGWASPLTITMGTNHTVTATFAPIASFTDVGAGRFDRVAIVSLATRGTIRGYQDGRYGPDDKVRRDQMAALIARAMPAGPGTPPTTLAPPNCLVAGTWDCEDWGNTFFDRGGADANLWRNAGTLQHYGVSLGYAGATCAAKKVPSPCFGPGDSVTYAQTISFITRAMKAKGYWVDQPGKPLTYQNVPPPHQLDVRTFHFYTQGLGGVPSAPTTGLDWDTGATRGWFARALWAALDSYWAVDQPGAGGYAP